MVDKIKFMIDNSYISDKHYQDFKEIRQSSQTIRNLILKNQFEKVDSLPLKIIPLLKDLREKENTSMKEVLIELEG
ncbi:hypothetical protein [Paenibacillus sp. JGP012]|uniref:hypothetical protein n=1 Tax=Paenibacillus sp. JGP012 TaxID=2735914 RepID=UPI001609B865|nr:hypothetical protein [Paenibacillus sp. JGP012]